MCVRRPWIVWLDVGRADDDLGADAIRHLVRYARLKTPRERSLPVVHSCFRNFTHTTPDDDCVVDQATLSTLVLAVDRASYDTVDQLQTIGDVCNAFIALAMLAGFLFVVIGLFTPTTHEERRHAFKRAVQKHLEKAEPAEAA